MSAGGEGAQTKQCQHKMPKHDAELAEHWPTTPLAQQRNADVRAQKGKQRKAHPQHQNITITLRHFPFHTVDPPKQLSKRANNC